MCTKFHLCKGDYVHGNSDVNQFSRREENPGGCLKSRLSIKDVLEHVLSLST